MHFIVYKLDLNKVDAFLKGGAECLRVDQINSTHLSCPAFKINEGVLDRDADITSFIA